ncbi:hypothetical protein RN001_008065 [Aquatica leii]|uniref:Phosphatidylethanolamine-binding protein n=1 Tax=Aquatica leii TaxID=1421715 RepID=A0AAN7PX44_9COLE|nr:hypothetical protein RN001_008065 [Aquatica leii]
MRVAVGQLIIIKRLLSVLQRAMIKDYIVPDVIDHAPINFAYVMYDNGLVDCGNELTPTDVKSCPSVTWMSRDTHYYTLCMTDPDAPSRKNPVYREWHHWLMVNIPGSSISLGETLSEYIGSAPPEGTGLHRYVFLVYEQPKKLAFDEERLCNTSAHNRAKFKIKKFADKYRLGNPIAGNYFMAKYDAFRFSARFYGLITEAMIKQGVVPDVIDCPPEERAEINYDNGVTVRDGNILTPTQVKRAPIVKWTTVCGCFYTVCMIDPDAPSRAKPELREWQHWLVVNIPSGKVRAVSPVTLTE